MVIAMSAKIIDVGVFAHNEAENITRIIDDLSAQDIFGSESFSVRAYILANGCDDGTACVARKKIASHARAFESFSLVDLEESGKSRTWNTFVHNTARSEADILILVDADIRIPSIKTLRRMVESLEDNKKLRVFTSKPTKDIEFEEKYLTLTEKVIAMGGGGLSNWKTSICGQLYAIRAPIARKIWLPIGLPVEDGFLRAMALTDFLTDFKEAERIDGDETVFHTYESIRTPSALIRHQTRIVIGSAINATIFRVLRRDAPTSSKAAEFLRNVANDETWLTKTISKELPRAPFGFVPFQFIFKRIQNYCRRPSLKRLPIVAFGFVFDITVYVIATLEMIRGRGSGYW